MYTIKSFKFEWDSNNDLVTIFLIVTLLVAGLIFVMLSKMRQPNPFEEAMALFHKEEFIEAVEPFKKVLEDEPFHPEAHFYLSLCYEKLNMMNDALKHLKEVRNIGIYKNEIKMLEVLHKIANYQEMLSMHNDALETNLEILYIEPNDVTSTNRLLLMSLGEKRFDIAKLYAEKAIHLDKENEKIMKAAAVAFYYSNKADHSFEIVNRLLEKNPGNAELELMFVSMCRNTHFAVAKEKILLLLKKVEDNHKKRHLIHFYLYIVIQEEKFSDAITFLERRVSSPDYPDSLREQMYFFYILFLLKITNYNRAEKAVEELFQFYSSSSVARRLVPFIKAQNLTIFEDNPQGSEEQEPFVRKFEDIYLEAIENLFPADILYQNGHYHSGFQLDFDKFFTNEQGNVVPKDVFSKKEEKNNENSYMSRYANMDVTSFTQFARKAVLYLGYQDGGKELTPSGKDGIDIIVGKQFDKSGFKYLISFRRFADNATMSDIYLTAYIARVKSLRVQKATLFSNATLTDGAQKKLLQETHLIENKGKEKLIELLKVTL